jgi:thiamine-phosphate pyrophosphorylase
MQRAIDAQRQGADYVAFGTMFSSPTKPDAPRAGPDMVGEAKKHDLQLPVCGIGGITLDNAALAIEQGADMIAVISTLFASKDIEGTARKLSGLFHQTS